eukprot:TRINITY_DN7224_c0_g2_i1.p2 TRINITY_DN7224_c0_g2~~TRINITY_DN7224_c0_g2_i1.p2  ORF type:complete len:199 (+),score=73.89 TRINITY_DN7224_c0_g2_i1:70-597(+)
MCIRDSIKITRHSKRQKQLSAGMRVVDIDTRKYVTQTKIDALESDFYDSPNRLAEDKSDEEDFVQESDETKTDTKKAIRKIKKRVIKKRVKKDVHLRKNLNLKKMIKDEGLENNESKLPHFINARMTEPSIPSRKFCSICGNFAGYTCPRCGEKYCGLKCFDIHKEVMCLKYDGY